MTEDETVIGCDESGSEGENLVGAEHRVFAHASVELSITEAAAVLAEARMRAPAQAPEYKAEHLLRAGAEPTTWLLGSNGPLAGHAKAYLLDKQYFVVSKVVDLLAEAVTHAAGENLYAEMKARTYARTLQHSGARAYGANWPRLLESFNSLMRARQRKGVKATVDEFFALVDELRLSSKRREVEPIMNLIWQSRDHAEEFQDDLVEHPDQFPALDPLIPALAQTIRAWFDVHHGSVHVIHDNQAALTRPRVDLLIDTFARPHRDFAKMALPVHVSDVDLVDSKADAREGVADLLAGISRHIATRALNGEEDELFELFQPFLIAQSLWSDAASWLKLSGTPMQ